MTTAVYLRVSSKGQKLASQKREVERYLDGHGITDAKWYVDTISTRRAITERPGLNELRRAIFDGQIDTVTLSEERELILGFTGGGVLQSVSLPGEAPSWDLREGIGEYLSIANRRFVIESSAQRP